MIRSFAHKGLERYFWHGSKAGIQPAHAVQLTSILAGLETARSLNDLNLAAFRLHPLHGRFEGFWSVRVSGAWRVIFRFEEGHAWEVNYVQYH